MASMQAPFGHHYRKKPGIPATHAKGSTGQGHAVLPSVTTCCRKRAHTAAVSRLSASDGNLDFSTTPPQLWPPMAQPRITDETHLDEIIAGCLVRLAGGDDTARDEILQLSNDRLRELSSRLLGKFAKVRRWDDTGDVAQNAAMRLYKALGETVPETPRGLMGLIATQIQRELIDLARKHAGPLSYAQNHDTNVRVAASGGPVFVVDEAADMGPETESSLDDEIPLERWEEFHVAVESLPEEHREVFRLVWYLGTDRETTAKTLGLSIRTVGRRWQEAREMVTAALRGRD